MIIKRENSTEMARRWGVKGHMVCKPSASLAPEISGERTRGRRNLAMGTHDSEWGDTAPLGGNPRTTD